MKGAEKRGGERENEEGGFDEGRGLGSGGLVVCGGSVFFCCFFLGGGGCLCFCFIGFVCVLGFCLCFGVLFMLFILFILRGPFFDFVFV